MARFIVLMPRSQLIEWTAPATPELGSPAPAMPAGYEGGIMLKRLLDSPDVPSPNVCRPGSEQIDHDDPEPTLGQAQQIRTWAVTRGSQLSSSTDVDNFREHFKKHRLDLMAAMGQTKLFPQEQNPPSGAITLGEGDFLKALRQRVVDGTFQLVGAVVTPQEFFTNPAAPKEVEYAFEGQFANGRLILVMAAGGSFHTLLTAGTGLGQFQTLREAMPVKGFTGTPNKLILLYDLRGIAARTTRAAARSALRASLRHDILNLRLRIEENRGLHKVKLDAANPLAAINPLKKGDLTGAASAWVGGGYGAVTEKLANPRKKPDLTIWTPASDRLAAAEQALNCNNLQEAVALQHLAIGHYERAVRLFIQWTEGTEVASRRMQIGIVAAAVVVVIGAVVVYTRGGIALDAVRVTTATGSENAAMEYGQKMSELLRKMAAAETLPEAVAQEDAIRELTSEMFVEPVKKAMTMTR